MKKTYSYLLNTCSLTVCIVLFNPIQANELPLNKNLLTNSAKNAIERQKEPDAPSEVSPSTNLQDYSVISEKPLFNANRTPVEEVIAKPVPPKPVIKAVLPKLVGIMTVQDAETAFVLAPGDASPTALKLDDKYKQWTLIKIEPKQITLSHEGIEETLTLDSSTANTQLQKNEQLKKADDKSRPTHSTSRSKAPVPPSSLKDRLSTQFQRPRQQ